MSMLFISARSFLRFSSEYSLSAVLWKTDFAMGPDHELSPGAGPNERPPGTRGTEIIKNNRTIFIIDKLEDTLMTVQKGKCFTAPVLFRTIVSKSGQL
jgi:hypothetical protein